MEDESTLWTVRVEKFARVDDRECALIQCRFGHDKDSPTRSMPNEPEGSSSLDRTPYKANKSEM